MEETRSQAEILVDIKKLNDRGIIALREEFLQKSSEIQRMFHWQQKQLRDKMGEHRNKAVATIEESKNRCIRSLVKIIKMHWQRSKPISNPSYETILRLLTVAKMS